MKKILKFSLLLVIFTFMSIIFFYIIAYTKEKPEIGQSYNVEIYNINDQLIYESNRQQTGGWVTLDEIHEDIINGFLATEDRNFYKHFGFDPIGIARALYRNITTNTSQGGSTITQQYAKILFLTNAVTWERKAKEAVYAAQIEMHYTKDEILEGYLNSIYFGHGVYGIENASRFFFNKTNKELTLSEMTLLVGIPNGPGIFSPLISMENSKRRQRIILTRMVAEGFLTEEEANDIHNQEIILNTTNNNGDNRTLNYYIDTVLDELKEKGILTPNNLHKGLKIYTNYDPDVQKLLEEAIDLHAPANDNMQVSAVIVQPYTNKVLALAGGSDYTFTQYNRATKSQRQIASTVKPLLYYLALENGFTPTTKLKDEPTEFVLAGGKTYAPGNYGNHYWNDDMTMINALAVSSNIYAVKTHLFLGEEVLAKFINMFGNEAEANASLAIGTVSMSIFDLVQMYSPFANEGLYKDIYLTRKVYSSDNQLLYQNEEELTQLLNVDTSLIVNQMMTSPFDYRNVSSFNPSLIAFNTHFPTAGKSGTSSWDSIIVGYNPYLLCGVWNGYDDNTELKIYDERKISRVIWQHVMKEYMKDKETAWYYPTDNIDVRRINPITGELSNDGSTYWFLKDTLLPWY